MWAMKSSSASRHPLIRPNIHRPDTVSNRGITRLLSRIVYDRYRVTALMGGYVPVRSVIPAHLQDDQRLITAVDAARAAGRIIRAAWRRIVEVEVKSPTNYVTAVDRAAEETILRRLRAAFPEESILAEETAEDVLAVVDSPSSHLWIVDPLDGTTNFVHRHPFVAVSIAYAERGVLTHGVVLDVGQRELYVARRGAGAYCNGQPIKVSGQRDLRRSLVGIGTPYSSCDLAESMARVVALRPHVSDIRRDGSAALDLAGVARGRLDAYIERPVSPWDFAAGALLVTEAGGVVSDAWGGPLTIASAGLAASTPEINSPLLNLVNRERINCLAESLRGLLDGASSG
jgi:myo-inositol-1(or 4)-monophosphatase